jgi:hypothetical protein
MYNRALSLQIEVHATLKVSRSYSLAPHYPPSLLVEQTLSPRRALAGRHSRSCRESQLEVGLKPLTIKKPKAHCPPLIAAEGLKLRSMSRGVLRVPILNRCINPFRPLVRTSQAIAQRKQGFRTVKMAFPVEPVQAVQRPKHLQILQPLTNHIMLDHAERCWAVTEKGPKSGTVQALFQQLTSSRFSRASVVSSPAQRLSPEV